MAVSLVHIQKVPLHIRLPKTIYSGADNSLVLLFPGSTLSNILIHHLELLFTIPQHFSARHCQISNLTIFTHNADFVTGGDMLPQFPAPYPFPVLSIALRGVALFSGYSLQFLKAAVTIDIQKSPVGVKTLSVLIHNAYT